MKLLDATGTPEIEQSNPWKERILSWMDHMVLVRTPIAKCAVAAMRAGYSMFAVQNGGWCAASATAPQTFDKYGKSSACKADGEGGPWANQVYFVHC